MSHPGFQRIANLLRRKSYCTGTLDVTSRQASIYYSVSTGDAGSDSDSARRVDLTRATSEQLCALSSACERSSNTGIDDLDVWDEAQRTPGTLNPDQFACGFNAYATKIMNDLQLELLKPALADEPNAAVRLDLSGLEVYDKGASFRSQREQSQTEEPLGSLLIIFPTPHEGGALTLRHKDDELALDGALQLGLHHTPDKICYVAFTSDVNRQVSPVTSGHRIILTYDLFVDRLPDSRAFRSAVHAEQEPSYSPLKSALQELLYDSTFLPDGGRIGFTLSHKYFRASEQPSLTTLEKMLKGVDATLRAVCTELQIRSSLQVRYGIEDYGDVLTDTIVDLNGENIYESVMNVLINDYDGEVLEAEDDWLLDHYENITPASELVTGDEARLRAARELVEEDSVEWVTEVRDYDDVKTEYIPYGGTPYMASIYGQFCIIVDVGEHGSRSTL